MPGRGDIVDQLIKHIMVARGHGDTHFMSLMATRGDGMELSLRVVGRVGGAVEGDVR